MCVYTYKLTLAAQAGTPREPLHTYIVLDWALSLKWGERERETAVQGTQQCIEGCVTPLACEGLVQVPAGLR